MSFEPGDVVKQKGQEQKMTVFRLLGGEESSGLEMLDDKYYNKGFTQGDPMCQWFVDNDLQSGTFHGSELEKYEAPKSEKDESDDELSFDDFDSDDSEGEDELNLDDFDF